MSDLGPSDASKRGSQTRSSITGFHSFHDFESAESLTQRGSEQLSTDEFFVDPFAGICTKSSIAEIEKAVDDCKALITGSNKYTYQLKRKLLARLVELRALQHASRELQSQKETSGSFRRRYLSESNSNFVQNETLLSLMSKSLIHQQNGHSFVSNFLAKEWGSVCESCCSTVHGSLKRFLSCTSCDAVLHWSQECMQGLTRRCPASQNIELYPLADEDHKLNIKCVFNFSASLATQHWRCAECGRGLLPPQYMPESLHLPEVTLPKAEANRELEQILDSVQPPLLPDPVLKSNYFCNDLGPLISPADAIVHAAVTKFRQSVKKVSELPSAKYCNYTGQYYCPRCHWDDTRVIPALYFMLNDRNSRLVCRTTVLWLDYAWTRCIFRVPNSWIGDTPKAQHMLALRLRLNRLKLYFPVCPYMAELKSHLLEEFAFPDWMLEQPYSFTMHFLDQLLDSDLLKNLDQTLIQLEEHLVSDCADCDSLSKCSVCAAGNQLLGSAVDATICSKCNNFCHRSCAKRRKSSKIVAESSMATFNVSQKDSWIDFEINHPLFDAICDNCAKNS